MQYMGSKNRFSKDLIPIIQNYIDNMENCKGFLVPFCGGANIEDKIQCNNKISCDNHYYLIKLLRHVQLTTEDLPKTILFEEYNKVRQCYNNKKKGVLDNTYEDWYIGLVGFCASFGNRFFDGGYMRNSKEDVTGVRVSKSIKNIREQAPNLKGIKFTCCDFRDLPKDKIKGYVIYCDVPYKNTKQYSTSKNFPYEEYYDWCRDMSKNNIILCSEYWMPDDFECIWEKKTTTQINSNRKANDRKNERVEKLYIYNKNIK